MSAFSKKNFVNKYFKKISPKINKIIFSDLGEQLDEEIDKIINLNNQEKFAALYDWAEYFSVSLEEAFSIFRYKANNYSVSNGFHEELFNKTWLSYIVINIISNHEYDLFSDYNGSDILSGYFEWFVDENEWYVLSYASHKKQIFCGWFVSEEELNHVVETCYKLSVHESEWNDPSYMLEKIEQITGEFYNEEAHGSNIKNISQYYEILGIFEGASQSEIKSAYRRKCREYHPDLYTKGDANEIMSRINEAYNFLKKI